MALLGDTGNGATLTLAASTGFSTSTTSLEATSISVGEQTVGSVDVSTLATTGMMESIPADLADPGDLTATFKWLTTHASTVACEVTLPAAAGTITLTFPKRANETQGATIIGSGFITSYTPPTLANGELQVGEVKWKWDGDTGPTYTAALP